MPTDSTVVKLSKKGKSIDLRDYLFKPKNTKAFTTLTERQKHLTYIDKIPWRERISIWIKSVIFGF